MKITVDTAYIADINRHKEFFNKGFIPRSLYFLSQKLPPVMPAYKACILRDERLAPAVLLIGVNAAGGAETVFEAVNAICRKAGITKAACGDIGLPPENCRDEAVRYYSGESVRFIAGMEAAFASGRLSADTRTVLLIDRETPESEIKYAAEKLNHVVLFGSSYAQLLAAADMLFAYNGTAALCARSAGSLKECGAAVVFNEKCANRLKSILKNTVMITFADSEATETVLYSENLGEFKANASYRETLLRSPAVEILT